MFSANSRAAGVNLPSTAQPGRIEQNSEAGPQPKSTGAASLEAPAPGPQVHGALTVTVHSISVEGATVFSKSELASLYASLIGTSVSIDRLGDVAGAITKKYRDRGYILAQAFVVGGQQLDPTSADVTIRVVEGYIDQIRYADPSYATGPKGARIRSYLDKIPRSCYVAPAPGSTLPCPLHKDILERYLLLARDLPGVDVETVLVPGEQPGSASLYVTITQKPLDAFVSITDRGTRYVGPYTPSAGVQLHNLFGFNDNTDIQYETSTSTNELQFVKLAETVPVGSEGLVASLDGSYATSHPGFTLGPADIDGQIDSVSVGLSYPLIRTRAENLSVSAQFSVRDFNTNSLGEPLYRDHLRVLQTGLTYDRTDAWFGGGVNLVDFQVSQGLPILGASPANSSLSSRAGGAPNFTKFDLTLSRQQQLADNFSLLLESTGQLALNKLLTSEEFGFGGDRFGRAYDPSELLGDDGIAFRAELQYALKLPAKIPNAAQLYGYYDVGELWSRHDCGCVVNPPQQSAASLGGGVRFNLTPTVSGYLEVAKPLTHIVQTQGNKDARFFFALTKRF